MSSSFTPLAKGAEVSLRDLIEDISTTLLKDGEKEKIKATFHEREGARSFMQSKVSIDRSALNLYTYLRQALLDFGGKHHVAVYRLFALVVNRQYGDDEDTSLKLRRDFHLAMVIPLTSEEKTKLKRLILKVAIDLEESYDDLSMDQDGKVLWLRQVIDGFTLVPGELREHDYVEAIERVPFPPKPNMVDDAAADAEMAKELQTVIHNSKHYHAGIPKSTRRDTVFDDIKKAMPDAPK